jgi:phytoene dehydrogenase-like protein
LRSESESRVLFDRFFNRLAHHNRGMTSVSSDTDAVVVGSGPNGLAAAVTLAQAGLAVTVLERDANIGGGARTAELTLPGVRHDVCSAVHPFGVASPFLQSLPMREHGLQWRWPEIDLAHPLDGDRAAVMRRSIDDTVTGLGVDGPVWRRNFGWSARHYPALASEIMQPLLHLPRHPIVLADYGRRAALPATRFVNRFATDEARALFGGIAAHMFTPLDRPFTASIGAAFAAAGHHTGWPVAAGGSEAITAALASLLRAHGGAIHTDVDVRSLADLPSHRVALFDTSPTALATIAHDRLPDRVARAYRRWRYGPAAFKVDLAVEGGVPWRSESCRRAGTVHVGGTFEQIAAGEAQLHRGELPARLFILVAQQYLCDPSRSVGGVHPVWAYAHVPKGYPHDIADRVIEEIEHFAPGLRDRIVGTAVRTPAEFEDRNPNYVGGDIACGANDLRQLVFRPRPARDPYATGVPGLFICSAATPPGAGVHGMCGHHAARSALRYLKVG